MKSRKAFLLRLDPRLYEELEAWASTELRSVNSQIEFLLTDSIRRHRKALPSTETELPADRQSESQ
ncbi:MAG: hypothetical protein DWI24_07975 [Planctomycetota bacterium]|nr:MAG: hypothetical protein DWI24_07975 [Planctomycetota bacterium]